MYVYVWFKTFLLQWSICSQTKSRSYLHFIISFEQISPLPSCFSLTSSPPRMPSRKGSSEHDDNGDAQSKHRPRRSHGRSRSIIITIIVIISQMRRAKLELCLSPSGWLTVTNSSLIHSTHQLYTGQRSPVRQEAVKAPLHVSSSRELQCKYIVQLSSSMTFFVLSERRRQLVIMPSTTAATCGCYVSHCEVRFKSRD